VRFFVRRFNNAQPARIIGRPMMPEINGLELTSRIR
jgi:CheY-like chemotaxis protein